ncbi:hypothetical protein Tco_0271082 [Tanacetum coccineum]
MSLSSALITTVALLIIVVVVAVVVVVVIVVVIIVVGIYRLASTVSSQMANPLAVIAPSVRLAVFCLYLLVFDCYAIRSIILSFLSARGHA